MTVTMTIMTMNKDSDNNANTDNTGQWLFNNKQQL